MRVVDVRPNRWFNRRMSLVPLQADGVYQWVGTRMGRTLLGTTQGSLVLTESHLAFVTTGSNDVPMRVVMATLGGILPAEASVALGVAEAAQGPLNRLLRLSRQRALPATGPGSWIAPLPTVTRCVHEVGSFSSYLSVTIQDAGRNEAHFALGRHVAFPEGEAFQRRIADLRR